MPISTLSLSLNFKGPQVKTLHTNLGLLGLAIPKAEFDDQVYGEGTQEVVRQFQGRYMLPQTGVFDETTEAALNNAVAAAASANTTPPKRRVEGRLYFENGLPAGNVILQLYHRGFGASATQLSTELRGSNSQGFYFLTYGDRNQTQVVNLEVRAVIAANNSASISAIIHNAAPEEVMNLVVPDSLRAPQSEYQRLVADLGKQLPANVQLDKARETAAQRDVTLLAQATGWDARLIALAATAQKLSAASETGIPADALYALFRAGLPMDKQQLAQVSAETVGKALEKTQQAKVVDISVNNTGAAKNAFETFVRNTRRTATAPGAMTGFDAMLKATANTLTPQQQSDFESIYFAPRDSDKELWEKAAQKGIPPAAISVLQTQGKLAYLTLNNVQLTSELQTELGQTGNLSQLVERDYDKPATWEARLRAMVNNNEQALQLAIPPVYTGEKVAERLSGYATDLARKVRLSFPTQVISRMIERNELALAANLKTSVRTFFRNAEGLGFELGRTPVQAFINNYRQNQAQLFPGLDSAGITTVTQSLKLLQRLYQITPTNEAMQALLNLGITSAHDVVAFPRAAFIKRFGARLGGDQVAELVYKKSEQVVAVVCNLTSQVKQLESAPSLHVTSAPMEQRKSQAEETRNALIKNFPTLESLFGSLDFCECEHCRSVLSPAAYFVDLLQLLEPEDGEWQEWLADWKAKHNNEPYQKAWVSPTGAAIEEARKKPYYALIERRPDLPYLPLTCENTNTAMPYIDLVNEVLEYFVAANDKKLPATNLGDTGTATTPELLAEPQNVIREAYNRLMRAAYPLELPFNPWLETARQFCEHFGTPLWKLAEILRPADDLFPPPGTARPYSRLDIFIEYLGLSPNDRSIFTGWSSNWHALYGYQHPDAALAWISTLQNRPNNLRLFCSKILGI